MKLTFVQRDYKNLRDYSGLRIWQKPKPTSVYAIGADVSEGIGGDASCASVVDCSIGIHVATLWSNTLDIDNYAAELFKLGHWYNRAFLCVEQNNHGNGVIALLGGSVGSLAYPNLYKRIEYDQYTARRTKRIGFHTSGPNKPRLIGNLNSALKSGELITYDRYAIQELGSFVKDERTGRLGAKGNAHDDRVMSLALAWEQAKLIIDGKNITKGYTAPNQVFDPMTGFPTINNTPEITDEYPF